MKCFNCESKRLRHYRFDDYYECRACGSVWTEELMDSFYKISEDAKVSIGLILLIFILVLVATGISVMVK